VVLDQAQAATQALALALARLVTEDLVRAQVLAPALELRILLKHLLLNNQ
jgi:hypothetical protein